MPIPLHFPVLWTHVLGCPFWRVWEPTWAAVTTAVATSAWPLASRHRFWRKEATQGLGPPVPVSLASPQARSHGLCGARGSDATTLRLWVSQEESVLLQRGCGWLQGSRPAPFPKPTAKGQRESLSLCIHCRLFTLLCALPSGSHKGPSQACHPKSLASPFPLVQFTSCPDCKHLFPSAGTLWDIAILLTSYA